MHFPCDESAVFDLQTIPGKEWRHAVVGGILLGYEARCWWLKNYSNYPNKAKDFSHSQMITVLQSLTALKAIGRCHVIHLTVDLDKAKQCQADLILPLFNQIINQPKWLEPSLYDHLERLEKMKPQTFAKAWTLLEVMTEGASSYLSCVGKKRSQDQRGLNIIIDDQVEEILPTLKHFIWFFLNCRAANDFFSFSSGVPKSMKRHIRLGSQNQVIDLTSIINITVGKQGEKLDDKYLELRLNGTVASAYDKAKKHIIVSIFSLDLSALKRTNLLFTMISQKNI